MASAVKTATSPRPKPEPAGSGSVLGWAFRVVDAIYRFLASVKLAVLTLGSLAAVLAYATFFESTYGTPAVQEWIYQSRAFSILLAFLGMNILCAALIRFPWKKRQTGFVVTHAGLLIVLGGSWYGLMHTVEGEVSESEGEVKNELIETDSPLIRVQELDPNDPHAAVIREWVLPFKPGTFAWGPGIPRPQGVFASLNPLSLLEKRDPRKPTEVLTKPGDPFQLVVKSHIPASIPALLHEPDPSGSPMAKIELHSKPPNAPKAMDTFAFDEDKWFIADKPFYRVARNRVPSSGQPLPARFTFTYADRPEFIADFLDPPNVEGKDGAVRIHYREKSGKARSFDLSLEGKRGQTIVLPDSDLKVKHIGIERVEAAQFRLQGRYDEPILPIAQFEVSEGNRSANKYYAIAMMPMFPNLVPGVADAHDVAKPLVSINYYVPPIVDPKTNGLFGVVEVLGTSDRTLYYRVFGRSKTGSPIGELRENKEALPEKKEIVAFGGMPGMPMTISFNVADYLTSGVTREICEPVVLPKNQLGNGLAASLVEMTLDDGGKKVTREFYLRRSRTFEPEWQTVEFPGAAYRIGYDLDRVPLGFDVKLEDFEVTFDPGTDQASSYVSKVLVTDPARRHWQAGYHQHEQYDGSRRIHVLSVELPTRGRSTDSSQDGAVHVSLSRPS